MFKTPRDFTWNKMGQGLDEISNFHLFSFKINVLSSKMVFRTDSKDFKWNKIGRALGKFQISTNFSLHDVSWCGVPRAEIIYATPLSVWFRPSVSHQGSDIDDFTRAKSCTGHLFPFYFIPRPISNQILDRTFVPFNLLPPRKLKSLILLWSYAEQPRSSCGRTDFFSEANVLW